MRLGSLSSLCDCEDLLTCCWWSAETEDTDHVRVFSVLRSSKLRSVRCFSLVDLLLLLLLLLLLPHGDAFFASKPNFLSALL